MAIQIKLEEGKNIKGLVIALNGIFATISNKLDGLSESLKELKDDVIIRDINEAKAAADQAIIKSDENTAAIATLREDINKIKFYYEGVNEENNKLKEKVNYLENYSRRNNLVIRGVAESDGEACEELVRTFMKDNLHLSDTFINSVQFHRCHRLGNKPQGAQKWVRPLIVRFLSFGDRQFVWAARSMLAKSSYSINENFSGDTEFNRRKMYPIFRAAKKMPNYEKKVSMVEDTLIIKNVRYNVSSLNQLPDDIHPNNFCKKSNASTLAFGGTLSEYCAFSNWCPSPINYNGNMYMNLEQAYMHTKAIENDDMVAAQKIRYTTDPREVKKIGSAITLKDADRWNEMKGDLMMKLVRAKFTQNPQMRKELLDTGTKRLGETGRDSYFSVGLPFTHTRILETGAWTAESHLGKALETVRAELRG